jgi:hypothetical protein
MNLEEISRPRGGWGENALRAIDGPGLRPGVLLDNCGLLSLKTRFSRDK